MIITHIMGGVGNQLFQYALGRCLAYKNNTELKLDIFQCESEKHSHHNYYRLSEFNIQENFATQDEIKSLKAVSENTQGFFESEILNLKDNVFLHGYWVNEKYFEDAEEILRQELTPKNPLGKTSNFWKEKILSAEFAVSLHIRHGDYLTPLVRGGKASMLPLDYYLTCVAELKKIFSKLTVFVFSDDLEWAKNNFKLDVPTEFVEGCERDVDELFLMSFCKSNITANSTFSWWGAWLNKNPDKKVFYPKNISVAPDPKLNSFYIPKNFTPIPVDYSKPPHIEFPPMLSIILHVKNNIDTINISLNSILSQNFKDYELIIIDSSTDDSGKLCRSFGGKENVTIIKESRSVKKTTAWNKGLKCARGYYVLFMTAKDFILPKTFDTLAHFFYEFLKIYTENQQRHYLSYQNYAEIYPNILCSVQSIAEDVNGDILMTPIKDKKFSLIKDPVFKEVRSLYEVEIDCRDKIQLLAFQQINNLIGTKIFKLKFLKDNNIYLDENLDSDAELKFLIDTFVHTKKITFISQLFYGAFS